MKKLMIPCVIASMMMFGCGGASEESHEATQHEAEEMVDEIIEDLEAEAASEETETVVDSLATEAEEVMEEGMDAVEEAAEEVEGAAKEMMDKK